ncbi:unnamed protein product [Ranitomeya imitator]|uniref:Uncharacterized protein n=1 Tax=Ranitomeya imitator TaxID=111125 RepID=A0ABN9LP32_9NEOB|nr:unnamed protein product [Ranitomeya imitator]
MTYIHSQNSKKWEDIDLLVNSSDPEKGTLDPENVDLKNLALSRGQIAASSSASSGSDAQVRGRGDVVSARPLLNVSAEDGAARGAGKSAGGLSDGEVLNYFHT